MATEEGIVQRIDPASGMAWVQAVQSSACASCPSKDSCHVDHGSRKMIVMAANGAGARPGDRVRLTIASSALLKMAFFTYLFPTLCMLAGGIAGHRLALRTGTPASFVAVIAAAVAFLLAFAAVRIIGRSMGNDQQYRPRIDRVLARGTGQQTGENEDQDDVTRLTD